MSAEAKRQIIQTLDELPEESVAAVGELVELLRAKAAKSSSAAEPRVVRLGGLWQGHVFSEQDIDDARREAWSGFEREPS